jgi:1-deoxy-D-xylulose-5-phosphate reductoisomerase
MRVTILGSTGSIGRNALKIIRNNRHLFNVVGLSCWESVEKLIEQIKEFHPKIVAVKGEEEAEKIKDKTVKVLKGIEGLKEIAAENVDILLNAISGFNGIFATISAIESGNRIALANKESLVAGGEFIKNLIKEKKTEIIPVDSEHSAVYRLMKGEKRIRKIILTASGGPFLFYSRKRLEKVKVEDALKHPKWKMGKKISVDSASFMNKALEVIEAHYLFDIPPERIEVLIHPEAIVHSMIELEDGSILAHLSNPDMRIPISFAFGIQGLKINVKKLELSSIGKLHFLKPSGTPLKALNLAYYSLEKGGTCGAILNAGNEVAVQAFLEGRLKFVYILQVVEEVLKKVKPEPISNLSSILSADRKAREEAERIIKTLEKK